MRRWLVFQKYSHIYSVITQLIITYMLEVLTHAAPGFLDSRTSILVAFDDLFAVPVGFSDHYVVMSTYISCSKVTSAMDT